MTEGTPARYPLQKETRAWKKQSSWVPVKAFCSEFCHMQAKLASGTQGIEWLNQWRNMDTEAFALIGTGFDCHVQHRLIKKNKFI